MSYSMPWLLFVPVVRVAQKRLSWDVHTHHSHYTEWWEKHPVSTPEHPRLFLHPVVSRKASQSMSNLEMEKLQQQNITSSQSGRGIRHYIQM